MVSRIFPARTTLSQNPPYQRAGAFTLLEIMIVVAILAILASLVPMIGSTDEARLRGAAQMLVADLELAQMQSIAHSEDGRVLVFAAAGDAYHLGTASSPATPIINPIDKRDYVVQFGVSRAFYLGGVTITGTSLGGDNQLGFGEYGQLDQATPATITLGAAGSTITITLDPLTGEVSVGPIS